MSTKLKRATSLLMSFFVAFSSMGSVHVSAEEVEGPSELVSEEKVDAPAEYTVTLPYYEECGYTYEESRVKERAGDIKLLYEANEKVAVSLTHTGQALIDQVRVIDSGNHEVSSSWDGSKMEFTMPEQDVSLNVSFVTPETDPPQTDPPQTDPPQTEPVQVNDAAENQILTESSPETVSQTELSQMESTEEVTLSVETEAVTESPMAVEEEIDPAQPNSGQNAEEPSAQPNSGQNAEESSAQPNSGQNAEEPSAQPNSGQIVEEPSAQPNSGQSAEETPAQPDQNVAPGTEIGAAELETTQAEETKTESTKPETYTAQTEEDGLPAQGSIEQVAPIVIPYDYWDFNEYVDFRNIPYDSEEFEIEYISDDIIYDMPGTYNNVYRVTDKASGKFWFVLRPVTVSAEIETEAVTVTESEILIDDPANESESEEETLSQDSFGEPVTEAAVSADPGTAEEDFITYTMEGEGTVTVFTYDENGQEEVICTLTKSGETQKVFLDEVEDLLRVRMTPNTGWFPYEITDGEDSIANLFTQTDSAGTYEGTLFFAAGDMEFRFIDEETLAGIPMLMGDGSMVSGGDYYWIYQKGATKGADIADPKKNNIFVVDATYKQHCNKENGGYTEFSNHPGSATISEDSEIAQYLGTTFKFNTCGVGSKPVPQTGNKGKLYILIKGVSKTSTGTKVSYQYFFWNSVSKYQSVYYKGTKTYTLYGLKIIKTLANEDDVAGCSAYDLAATFTIKDSKGKVVKTVTTDADSGEILITDLDEGTYTITETKTSKGATVYVGAGKTVQYTKEKIMSVKFQNYAVVIELTVEKRDSDGVWDDSMKGAVYSLRDDKDDEKTEIEKITINSKSVKVKTPLCVNKTYYLVEIEEPTSGKWALNSKPVKVSTAVSAEKLAEMEGSDNVIKMTSKVTEYPPSPIKVRIEKKTNLIETANGNKAEWLDNGYYNLKGATYGFYSDKACQDLIGTAVIKDKNSEGHYYSNWVEIPITDVNAKTITVYYRETKRPNGHIQDKTIHSLTLNVPEDTTKTVSVTEETLDDFTYARLDALVTKVSPTGEPLEGAEFTLTYYAQPQSDEIVYQWVFRTNEEGKLDLWKPLNGETVFVNNPGTAILFPEGYYSIQETKAPDGYVNVGFYKEFTLTPSTPSAAVSCRRPIRW